MPRPASHDRHGSNSGRGFRYQDAVAAWLSIRVWAGVEPQGTIIPEGGDDVERRSAQGSSLVQVKSRREHLGELPTHSAKDYIKALWERHDRATVTPVALDLIVERAVVGHAAQEDGRIPIEAPLERMLPRGDRGRRLLAKTVIVHAPEPQEASIGLISDRIGSSPLAAQICFAQLLKQVGALADQNGRLRPSEYRGLSSSDTDRIISDTLAAIDADWIERALRDGACEPVDFLTPLVDPDFYLGVDVQPGHIAAGLVLPRIDPRDAVARGLDTHGAALIAGPSGAGKSAIMWDTAHALRHTVRWYRILRLDQGDIPALRQLLRNLRAGPDSPVGIVVDDVGRRGAEGWDALTREFAAIPGALLLGSIREEDLFLLAGRSRAVEVRAEPDTGLGKRLFEELRRTGRTEWPGWQEPWQRSQGLVLEYVHILSAGRRFEETLAEQVDERQRDAARAVELSTLRVVAFAGAGGAAVDVTRLAPALSVADDEVARGLRRLIDEHLVRESEPRRLTGLHQLRSAELLRLSHEVPPPTIEATFARAVDTVSEADLEPLVADAVRARGIAAAAAASALAARLTREPHLDALSAMLRGLGAARIASAATHWVALPSVKMLPRTQVGLAAMIGISGVTMPDVAQLSHIVAAAADLAGIRADVSGDPRRALLDALPAEIITTVVTNAVDSASLDRFLSAQVGLPLHQKVAAALDARSKDILDGPLDAVAGLLGTLTEIDHARATAWVDEVGEEGLVSRLSQEVPWATAVSFEEADEGRVVRCDFHQVYDPGQGNPHDHVVRICEIALALSPRSDIAASAARAPNGEVAGSSIVSLAEKRIPRENLPTAALPAWNRRWRDAIAAQVATPSYSAYLRRAAAMLGRLAPALERTFDAILRGRNIPVAQIEALAAVHEEARSLTPPGVAAADASGAGPTESNNAVTELQNVLFGASADVVRRFAQLPDGAGAYVAWVRDLIGQLEEAERDEPWGLISGAPSALRRVRDSLDALRAMAGELTDDQVPPATRWASAVSKARPGNALRLAGTIVANRMASARRRLGADLRERLAVVGVEADIRVREDPSAVLPWPPSKVLALVPIDTFADVETFMIAAAVVRQQLSSSIRLTVMPKIGHRTIPSLGLSGYDTLLPLPEEADDWVDNLALPAFRPTVWPILDSATAMGSALKSMDRLSLGGAGRPSAEIETRQRLEEELRQTRESFDQSAGSLSVELVAEANEMLIRIRSGDIAYADAMHEAMNGATPAILEEISALAMALNQAEFDELD